MTSAGTTATTPARYDEFDLLGPLPIGTTVLEASAGTARRTPSLRSSLGTSPRASRA